MTEYGETLNELLSKIRVNAVLLVDAFDWLDSNLCNKTQYFINCECLKKR